MRVSSTMYDIAGPQLYHRLPGPAGLKLKRLQATLARDKPVRVFALMRHTAIIHFTDGLRTTLLSAIERGDLVMPNIKHVIIDGLAVESTNASGSPPDNDRLLSASSDITLVCHASKLDHYFDHCWQPYLSPSVRHVVVLLRPRTKPCSSGSSYSWRSITSVPATVEQLAIVLTPMAGQRLWSYDGRGQEAPREIMILAADLAPACLARAKRIVIAGADRVDPSYWDCMARGNPEVMTVEGRMLWLETKVRKMAMSRAYEDDEDEDEDDDLDPRRNMSSADVDKHLERVEFVTWERYQRGLGK